MQPEVARAQIDAERAAEHPDSISLPVNDGAAPVVTTVDNPDVTPAPPKPKTRYYGSVLVDPQRAMRDLSQIADEIIARLASIPGAAVGVTVEIEGARGDGFDDATVRAISENSRTLNFNDYGFED
ncbi:MAG: hypothetical protein OXT68_06305 [Chloroflexota bacterium]|nr:hypothetical protein [Chloroflexota bacterium]